ncbi:MAG TPA: carboxypeptidase-like regulatory domain-containing protein [Candidatus Eisenbacteria bacterium]|nr:carboxypeptidase-like regulatory domain-containing protein [Candidatus Eisenbacteria bacterium]
MRLSMTTRRAMAAAACAMGLMIAASGLADDPAKVAVILGTVVREADGEAIQYANVIVSGTKIGTQTDERGRFRLDVPTGSITLRIAQIGSPPLTVPLTLAAGDTLRPTYRMTSPPHDRFAQIRDSLSARGLWPPTLDPELRQHMREALDVRVFRLDPDHPVFDQPPDREKRIGPWPIVGEAPEPDRALMDELTETLRESGLYLPRIRGEIKLCGGFAPGVDVRFTSTGVPVDVLLCFKCGEFSVWRDGKPRQSGDFGGQAVFARVAQQSFPKDPAFKKLGKKAR